MCVDATKSDKITSIIIYHNERINLIDYKGMLPNVYYNK